MKYLHRLLVVQDQGSPTPFHLSESSTNNHWHARLRHLSSNDSRSPREQAAPPHEAPTLNVRDEGEG
jgi:hypothetical protein